MLKSLKIENIRCLPSFEMQQLENTLDENISDRNTYELIAIAIAFIRQNHLQI